MWTAERIKIGKEFYLAIERRDVGAVRALCAANPWLVTDHLWDGERIWLQMPAWRGCVEVLQTLLDLGFNVNALRLPEKNTALSFAVDQEHFEVAEYLLSRGADPNFGRAIIGALRISDPKRRREYVQLLVRHRVDVNQLFDVYGDKDNLFTALDWAKNDREMAALLRAQGAKTAKEIKATKVEAKAGKETPPAPTNEIIAYFASAFGPVKQNAIVEIVPTGHPVAIHAVEPSGSRKHLTLFTTGLSAKPMKVPKGKPQFALAELFIELPGNWQYNQLDDRNYSWPIVWLRKIAQYPHDHKTWLGGPLTIIANGDPPKPLAPKTKFTSLLLLAEKSFIRTDGQTVQLYRVTPLYSEERDLEMREGAQALLRAFDRRKTPFVVDLDRPNVAT